MSSRMQALAVMTGIAITAGIGYAVYFDHKRRNDPTFRKHLRREQKRIEKEKKEVSESVKDFDPKHVLEVTKDEEYPTAPEQREQYFMTQVALGEQLSNEGKYAESVIPFYKALKVYPAPAELLGIYEKTVHPTVFTHIKQLLEEMKPSEDNPLD